MPEPTSRRDVLRLLAVGGAALTGLAGCDLPGPGRQDPDPGDAGATATGSRRTRSGPVEVADLTALDSALRRTRQLAALADRARARGGARAVLRTARGTLATQGQVLQRLLEAAAVPLPEPPGADRDGRPSARRLGRAMAEDVGRPPLTELATVTSANLAMLTSLTGQRGALATLLGAEPGWPPLAGPTGQPAASMLDAFRPAVYGFEVLAARTGGQERESYERTLGQLRRVTRVLTELAGAAAPPAPLGYGLPGGPGRPDGRRALARELLVALPPAVVRDAGGHTGDLAAVAGTVQLVTTAVTLGHEWGAPAAAFPGMTVP